MMPRYSRREAVVLLLLIVALALYIWSPLLFGGPAARDWKLETRDRKTIASHVRSRGLGGWSKPQLTGLIDLNAAGRLELEKLPGIGPTLADRIVQHRDRYGPFRKPEDLMQVEGIGEKRYERIRLWVTIRNPKLETVRGEGE